MKMYIAATTTLIALTGCATATGPAEVTGEVTSRPNMVVSSALIWEVDGVSILKNSAVIESGKRHIRLQAHHQPGFRGGELKNLVLNVKPCVRYTLAVKRESEKHMDWEPIVLSEEPMAGCTPKS